jgi:replicative DNA helicase
MADSDNSQRLNIDESSRSSYPLEKMRGGQGQQQREKAESVHEQSGRVPPQAIDVEKSVLGAMLIEREAIPQVVEILPPDAFYDNKHQKIYEATQDLFQRGNPVDLVTLTEELRRRDELEDIGGAYYLTELTTQVASAANVEYHSRIIAEKSLLRKMIETMTTVVRKAYDPGADAFELLDEAESKIFQISDNQLRKAASPMNEVVKDTLERLETIHGQDGGITGVPSGFPELDDLTSGWQDSDLIIIAARPSMGKTAFSLAAAQNAATHPEHSTGVAVFSLEMGAQQLAQRMLTSQARVDAHKARTGRMADDDWQRLARAAGDLSEASIYIDDTPGLSVLELRAKCRRLKAEHDLGLVVVDYLQLMQASGANLRSGANREQEIAHISRSLKGLAKELDIPVIALSQLNRAVENRGGDKRPQLSDLRESGCLTGDTLVPMADTGERVPMNELCGTSGFKVWSVNPETYELEKQTVTNAFCTGSKPVYRLQTQLGREVRATGNHEFLTIDGWKRLDELEEGEHVALPRHLDTPSEQTMSENELALLGHLIGDGCTVPGHAIQYTTNEHDLAERVASLASSVFESEIDPRIHEERDWYQVYLSSTRTHTHGVHSPVREWLANLEVWGLRAHEKRIPERVFRQPSDAVTTFLRHLWASDGCVRMRGGSSPYPAVYYATSSKRLARDVQSLLVRLGINARRKHVDQKDKGRAQHHVIVSGDDLSTFASRIGAAGEYKQTSLENIREYLDERTANTNRDIIPKATWRSVVVPAMNDAGMTTREMQSALGVAYCGTSLYTSNMSRERAARVAGTVSSETLRRLASSDVYWDQVASVEEDGVEKVYDLTVPGPKNFVANDIVVHNSIEQDADVVAFIYRAERYGITVDEQGNSTEGIAEIIVEKQRNGPIGAVELAFVKQYARFEPLTQYEEPGGGPPQGDGSAPMGSAPGGDGEGGSFEDDAPF